MADFLSRFAGRALGVLPRAEPVIPAAFAPALRAELDEAPPPHAVEPPRLQEFEAAPEPPVRALEVIEETFVETPEPVSDRTAAGSLQHPATRQDGHTEELQRDIPAAAAPARAVAVRAAKDAPPHLLQTGRPSEPPPTDASARPLHMIPARQAIAETPGLPVPAATPPVQPGRRQQRMEQSAAQSPGPVRITIGRVEVRALMPPATGESRPRPEPPKGVLTLEEYTRQRRRGER